MNFAINKAQLRYNSSMTYLAILGRQPKISLAELEAKFSKVHQVSPELAEFENSIEPNIDRLGGSLKLAVKLENSALDFLRQLPEGKITLGVSDYSKGASKRSAQSEALKLKKILTRHGRSVRVLENKSSILSTATSHHNQIGAKKNRIELVKFGSTWYHVVGVQNITAYAKRDQARPARDAKVGMLPPKLAQILINLCGDLPARTCILDPFCGTGVVLQEAARMGYQVYGTDLNPRMVEYTGKNLKWAKIKDFKVELGDATNYQWQPPIGAIVCEAYLGPPMSAPPIDIKLKEVKQQGQTLIKTFLKNLSSQIASNTPVVLAIPAWRRTDGSYARLNLLDEIKKMGYNSGKYKNLSHEDMIYYREGQIVAREIIVLRKI